MTDAAHGGSERLVADALPLHRALALIDAANGGNPVTEAGGCPTIVATSASS